MKNSTFNILSFDGGGLRGNGGERHEGRMPADQPQKGYQGAGDWDFQGGVLSLRAFRTWNTYSACQQELFCQKP